MRKVSDSDFELEPSRYTVRKATERGNPLCPTDQQTQWLGFDLSTNEFIELSPKITERILDKQGKTD